MDKAATIDPIALFLISNECSHIKIKDARGNSALVIAFCIISFVLNILNIKISYFQQRHTASLIKNFNEIGPEIRAPSLHLMTSENVSIYAPGFVARFMESHAVMFQGNSGLRPKEGESTSRPWQWPINYRGQFFSGNDTRIYLLGNPIIWWSNLIFMNIFVVVYMINTIRRRRQESKCNIYLRMNLQTDHATPIIGTILEKSNTRIHLQKCQNQKIDCSNLSSAVWLYTGWVIHYIPFWAMGRVLYFHHYFPAVIFNSMLSGIMFHYITEKLPSGLRYVLFGIMLSVLAYSFKLFAPLSYGMNGPFAADSNSRMHGLKWLPTWEF